MIERHSAAPRLAARAAAILLLGTCGPALAASEPAQRSALVSPSAPAAAPRARAVPMPLPRPAELDAEDVEQASAEASADPHGEAPEGPAAPVVAAPLPKTPPSLYTPRQAALAPQADPPGPSRTVIPPPAAVAPEHSAAANEAPRGKLPAACAALVQSQIIVASPAPAIGARPGCSLPTPVELSGVRMDDGTTVALSPAAILRCDAVVAVAQWVREDLSRAAADLGSRLDTVKVAASYDCRPRNRVAGAKMSDHGQGIAMDVGGVVLEDKRVFQVKDNGLPMALQASMKASFCSRFTTVLGPGSDGYHEDHVHIDLAQRYLNIRLCRWEIRPTTIAVARAAYGVPAPAPAVAAPSTSAAAPPQGVEAEAEDEDVVPLPLPRPPVAANARGAGKPRSGG
ncbi:extensin family protein [Azorhizobium doebereinerae]|uniref:extensin family protein n=1 Tax=Azorhizobium doebereinerae TaxID=281091 RepID=UPI0003FA7D1C|nr:extensin family protein [Azorhizobium doebereinerae]